MLALLLLAARLVVVEAIGGGCDECEDSSECSGSVCEIAYCEYDEDAGSGDDTDDAIGCCQTQTIPNCCEVAGDCTAPLPCQEVRCVSNTCHYAPIGGCCTDDLHCIPTAGMTACKTWSCLPDNTCSMGMIPGCCTMDSQCADEDPCTTNACVGNVCVDTPVPGCCTMDGECGDGDACTSDRCTSFACVNTPIPGCCNVDGDCDDGDACTTDECLGHTCVHTPIPGCCNTNATCSDGNACTLDVCTAPGSNSCVRTPIDGCCLNDGECPDPDICTVGVCRVSPANTCANYTVAGTGTLGGCCVDNSTCAFSCPGNTVYCNATNQCDVIPTPGFCAMDSECDDGDVCTSQSCDGGVCVFTPIPNCCDFASGAAGNATCVRPDACLLTRCLSNNTCLATARDNCCQDVSDCSQPDNACLHTVCDAHVCHTRNKVPFGECYPCEEVEDCPLLTAQCKSASCNATGICEYEEIATCCKCNPDCDVWYGGQCLVYECVKEDANCTVTGSKMAPGCCVMDSDCMGTGLPFCQNSTMGMGWPLEKTCVECRNDTDCGMGETCGMNGMCMGCTMDSDCSGNMTHPYCEVATGTCQPCWHPSHCSAFDTPSACDSATCAGRPGNRFCQTVYLPRPPCCDTSANCSANAPVCDTSVNECVGCLVNGDCTHVNPCLYGQCRNDTECPNECEFLPTDLGTPCDDGNPATTTDICNGYGVCVGGNETCVTSADCPAPTDCSAYSCFSGVCIEFLSPNTTMCDAGACAVGMCDGAGTCASVADVTCTQTSNPCRAQNGTCSPSSGDCRYLPTNEGGACSCGGTPALTGECVAGDCRCVQLERGTPAVGAIIGGIAAGAAALVACCFTVPILAKEKEKPCLEDTEGVEWRFATNDDGKIILEDGKPKVVQCEEEEEDKRKRGRWQTWREKRRQSRDARLRVRVRATNAAEARRLLETRVSDEPEFSLSGDVFS